MRKILRSALKVYSLQLYFFICMAVALTVLALGKRKFVLIFFFLGTALMSLLSIGAFLSPELHEHDIYRGLSKESLSRGLFVNLLYLIVWQIGFLLAYSLSLRGHLVTNREQHKTFTVLLIMAIIGSVIHHSAGVEYGGSLELYSANYLTPKFFGVFGSYAGVLDELAGAYLILSALRKRYAKIVRSDNQLLNKLSLAVIVGSIFIGIFLENQRADVFQPTLYLALYFFAMGKVKKATFITLSAILLLTAVSPIMEGVRNPNLWGKLESPVARYIETLEAGSSFENTSNGLVDIISEKSILGASTYNLINDADINGHSFFQPYLTTILAVVPRFIFPQKVIGKSEDGTLEGQAQYIAGGGRDVRVVWWVTGGGTTYWEFGIIGVVIGGFLVGALWPILITSSVKSGRPEYFALVLYLMNWGLGLVGGPSDLLFSFTVYLKVYVLALLLRIFIPRVSSHNRYEIRKNFGKS